ncbi:MAG: restriction endonuclease subunit S [Faecousia sp.]
MTPQELKSSILQLAVQGKLVEQRPEEGTGEELLKMLHTEKEQIIKSGALRGRKTKPLESISLGDIPFEIPNTWKWIRLGTVTEIFGRIGFRGYTKNDIVSAGKGAITISPSNIHPNGKTDFSDCTYLSWSKYEESPEIKVSNGDILLVKTGSSYGKCGIVCDLPEKATINPQLAILKHITCDVNYLDYVLKTPMARSQFESFVIGTSIPTFSQEKLANLLLPLPPLAEQKRIVAKIEALLPYIDRYEKAWSRMEDLNKRFPVDMQKSILQMAIQGKLVEQRPEEGNGEELYQQIQVEKQKLINAGKIKKEKPLPEISEDEIPFDIPERWRWIRLGCLTELITSGSRDWAQYYSTDGDIFLRMGNLSRNSFNLRLDKIQRVKLPESAEGKRTSLQAGDLLFSITGEVGTLGLIPDNFGTAYISQHTAMIRFLVCERNRYIPFLLLSDYAQKFYNGNQHGIKNSFRLDTIAMLPIPLPPLAEQKRIVAKLEEILLLCEKLK